jgi:hypothetical protein
MSSDGRSLGSGVDEVLQAASLRDGLKLGVTFERTEDRPDVVSDSVLGEAETCGDDLGLIAVGEEPEYL